MVPGEVKIFTKSGNKVRLIERSSGNEWVVERTDGSSKGKRLICRESALIDTDEE